MPPDPDTSVNPDPDDPDDAPEDNPKTYTLEQAKGWAAREHSKGSKAAKRKLLEESGFDSEDDLKRFLEEAKAASSKDEDDAVKARKKAEERERKADERERKAIRKGNEANVFAALIAQKMDPEKAVLAANMVKVDLSAEDLEEDEILEAVDTLKEKMPELFGEPKEETEKAWRPTGSPDSTSRGGQRRRPQSLTNAEKAKNLLAARHPKHAANT